MTTSTVPARRRLVKGALAAPVVLTVSSASAASLTSFGRCLRNGIGNTNPAFFIDAKAAPDQFVRLQIKCDVLWAQGQIQGTFYMDPVLNRYVSTSYPYAALSFGSSNLPGGWKVSQQIYCWGLQFFEEATASPLGRITVQRPYGYSATTVSCYSSFGTTA